MNKPTSFPPNLSKAVGCIPIMLMVAVFTLGSAASARAAQGTQNVVITNTPLPVREVGNAIEPFQWQGRGSFSNGVDGVGFVVAVVPAGKRLVIEFVTVNGSLPDASLKVNASITTVVGGTGATYTIPTHDQGPFNDPANVAVAQPVRIYGDPSTTVEATVYRTPSDFGGSAILTISGHYVNLSQ